MRGGAVYTQTLKNQEAHARKVKGKTANLSTVSLMNVT